MEEKDKPIDDFSKLGFSEFGGIPLYKSQMKKQESENSEEVKEQKEEDFLYTKQIECPVCYSKFNILEIKANSYTIIKTDTDFLNYYTNINPLFYGVYVCDLCGYAALRQYFPRILPNQRKLIKEKITPKWMKRNYGNKYDLKMAIERYKLALISAVAKGAKSGEIASVCLRLGWLYRLSGDGNKELYYLSQTIYGFKEAITTEGNSVAGIDDVTLTYMIGEILRRTGEYEQALLYFGKVIFDKAAKPSLKDRAHTQRDVAKKQLEKLKAEVNATPKSVEEKSEDSKETSTNESNEESEGKVEKKKFFFF